MDRFETIIVFGLPLIAAVVVATRAHRARFDELGLASKWRSRGMGAGFIILMMTLVACTGWTDEWLDDVWTYLNGWGQWYYSYDVLFSYVPALIAGVLTLLMAQYATMRWDWRFGACMVAIGVCGAILHPSSTVSMSYGVPVMKSLMPLWSPPILPMITLAFATRIGRPANRSTTCVVCGYDLSGSVGEAPCPECGTGIARATYVRGRAWRLDLASLARGALGWVGATAIMWVGPIFAKESVALSYFATDLHVQQQVLLAEQYEFYAKSMPQLIWPCVLVALALPTAAQFRIVRWWMVAMVLAVTVTTLWWGLKR